MQAYKFTTNDEIVTAGGYVICWSKEQQVWVVTYCNHLIGKFTKLERALVESGAL